MQIFGKIDRDYEHIVHVQIDAFNRGMSLDKAWDIEQCISEWINIMSLQFLGSSLRTEVVVIDDELLIEAGDGFTMRELIRLLA